VPQLLARLFHLALLATLLLGHQGFAQVSDGQGLTPLEGVLPIPDDRALWDAVKDSRDANDFKAYLNKFPNGLFAELATNRMRALAVGTTQPPQPPSPPITQFAPQAPLVVQRQNLVPGQIIKDCADCPEMVVIPPGSFDMGSGQSLDEQPVHRVSVPIFLMGKTEVTQGQWRAVMGSNPSRFNLCGDDCPVEQVNWDEAQEFTNRLSQKTGKQYRLPSEAEWEYAARAGSTTKRSFGDDESQLGDHAWYLGNSKAWFGENKTQRVAQKRPNAFGLFDMYGNVWEWVQDCWHYNYAGAPTDGSAWTTTCSYNARVLRGGSWGNYPSFLRSAIRTRVTPGIRSGYDGLRLARTP
jgi:formylglycine-generating enzyme required for sulfatase activity